MDIRVGEENIKENVEDEYQYREQYKYPALRAISGWYKFLGWICILIGAFFMFTMFQAFFIIIPATLFSCLFNFAIAELIKLFIDIEENTRRNNLK